MTCSGCDWDPKKDLDNQRKHGIAFEDACCVFDDPHRSVVPDEREYDERRWLVTGRVDSEVMVVVFTSRGDQQRIISARKAKRREEQAYYERSF